MVSCTCVVAVLLLHVLMQVGHLRSGAARCGRLLCTVVVLPLLLLLLLKLQLLALLRLMRLLLL